MQQKITIYGQQFTSYHQRVLEVSSGTGALLAVGLACAELNSRRRERGRRVRKEEEQGGEDGKEGEKERRERRDSGKRKEREIGEVQK